jgi:hypothetical protein
MNNLREFLIRNIELADIVSRAAKRFECSRQTVYRHLKNLVAEGVVEEAGNTKGKVRRLTGQVFEFSWEVSGVGSLSESDIWHKTISPLLAGFPPNVLDIWHYGFTEIFNNAIEHSGASRIAVMVRISARETNILVQDDGVGIFRKIKEAMNLADERHAVLELAKGKLTTAQSQHSGEGIFFTSRMFDEFNIFSGNAHYSYETGRRNYIGRTEDHFGTIVWMMLDNETERSAREVFDKFTSGEDYGFDITIVPVKLAEYGDDSLISRSQARRLLNRFDRFRTVILDFAEVSHIGQAFADEVFRVFANDHPKIEILTKNCVDEVQKMISRALSAV